MGPKLFNKLIELKNSTRINIFKNNLKMFPLEKYFYSIAKFLYFYSKSVKNYNAIVFSIYYFLLFYLVLTLYLFKYKISLVLHYFILYIDESYAIIISVLWKKK